MVENHKVLIPNSRYKQIIRTFTTGLGNNDTGDNNSTYSIIHLLHVYRIIQIKKPKTTLQFSVFSLILRLFKEGILCGFSPHSFLLIALTLHMNQYSRGEHNQLLTAIFPIILEKGLKCATMDLVARRLGMSKRTLYEIFQNKSAMIFEVLDHNDANKREQGRRLIDSAPDMMVALLKIINLHRQDLQGMNPSFFKDMDRLYPEMRHRYEERHQRHREALQALYEKGVEQGVFRDDINFLIVSRMMEIQGESLKRMEELFPPEITLLEIYDTMSIGFLRTIASRRGNDLLDAYLSTSTEMQSLPIKKL